MKTTSPCAGVWPVPGVMVSLVNPILSSFIGVKVLNQWMYVGSCRGESGSVGKVDVDMREEGLL